MAFLQPFFLLFLLSQTLAHETFDSHLLPRPLIRQFPDKAISLFRELDEETKLKCTSWRFNVEANNLSPWKTIPQECAEYVKEYITGPEYGLDVESVAKEAEFYAKTVKLVGDGLDAWIFDIDETLLSNLPYYTDHGYGLDIFNPVDFDNWIQRATAPAIEPSLKLYKELMDMGIKLVLLTGRSESQREITTKNLMDAGYYDWDRLILRTPDDQGKLAVVYKSEARSKMENEGYRIIGNSGDQWSDLLGTSVSIRSFKLPNPMYYIA